ncbi:MAG: AgmX/PglI C-terminal domain-containing protein [Bacteriovoracaceae bacterium]|nr:AgmX/PglI C-terminal domain-containing protein [Bacteriovoracaceae bacterium]
MLANKLAAETRSFTLIIVNEKGLSESWAIAEGEYLLGSDPSCAICLKQTSVAHRYGLLKIESGDLKFTRYADKKVFHAKFGKSEWLKCDEILLQIPPTTQNKNLVAKLAEEKSKPNLSLIEQSDLPPRPPHIPEFPRPQFGQEEAAFHFPKKSIDQSNQSEAEASLSVIFDESQFSYSETLPIDSKMERFEDYIDVSPGPARALLPQDKKTLSAETLELLFLSYGNIVDYEFFSMKSKYVNHLYSHVSSAIKMLLPKEQNWLRWENGKLSFTVPDGWVDKTKTGGDGKANSSEEIREFRMSRGVNEIIIRRAKSLPRSIIWLTWPGRAEFFRVSRLTFLIFLPFLILSFLKVNEIKEEEDKKEEIVILKRDFVEKIQKAQEANANLPSASPDDQERPEDKSLASAKNNKNKKNKTKSQSQTPTESKSNEPQNDKVAEAAPSETKPKINLAGQFKGLLGDKLDLSNKELDNRKAGDNKNSGAGTNLNGSLGGASKGKLETAGGGSANGLAVSGELSGKGGFRGKGQGKSDFDSAFTSTKTVVLGSIDPELLRKILREYIPQFRYCYQEELSSNAQIGGVMDLNFTLDGEGRVTDSKVVAKTGKFSGKGINCINGVLKSINFPKPKGGGKVEVKQPLNFTSEKNKIN